MAELGRRSRRSWPSGPTGAQPTAPPRRPDAPNLAPYVPTPQEVVDRMLALAKVTREDVVIDLGCGDGRIPITAAKVFGARGIGVDIDPQRIAEANANARREGVTHLVTFKLENALTTDVSSATVVTTYLLSASNLKLRPVLTRALKPGTRIVAHNYGFGDWVAREDRDLHRQREDPPHHLPVDGRRDRASVAAGYAEPPGRAPRAHRRARRAAPAARQPAPGGRGRGAGDGRRRLRRRTAVAVVARRRRSPHSRRSPSCTRGCSCSSNAPAGPRRTSTAGLARLEHRWQGRGSTGAGVAAARSSLRRRPRSRSAPGSLFELLSTARTTAGERTLAGVAAGPGRADRRPANVRQPARDLAGREAVPRGSRGARPRGARGRRFGGAGRAGRGSAVRPPPVWGPPLLAVLAAGTVAGIGVWLGSGEPPPWLLPAAYRAGRRRAAGCDRRCSRRSASSSRASHDLALVAAALARVEQEPFTAPRLAALHARLSATGVPASHEVRRLSRLVDLLTSRRNQFFAPVAFLVFWATHLAWAVDRWRLRVGAVGARLARSARRDRGAGLAGRLHRRASRSRVPRVRRRRPAADGARRRASAAARRWRRRQRPRARRRRARACGW